MKVYVASSLNNRENAAALIASCKELGFEITYDWTLHGYVDPKNKIEIAAIALGELNGVLECNALLLLLPGRLGSHVELGAALATNKKIYIIGHNFEQDHSPSFYSLPSVTHVSDTVIMKTILRAASVMLQNAANVFLLEPPNAG